VRNPTAEWNFLTNHARRAGLHRVTDLTTAGYLVKQPLPDPGPSALARRDRTVVATDGSKYPPGDPSEVIALRSAELRVAFDVLGLSPGDVTRLPFVDTKVARGDEAMAMAIAEVVAAQRPAEMMVTSEATPTRTMRPSGPRHDVCSQAPGRGFQRGAPVDRTSSDPSPADRRPTARSRGSTAHGGGHVRLYRSNETSAAGPLTVGSASTAITGATPLSEAGRPSRPPTSGTTHLDQDRNLGPGAE
jgi:hypothetical protein